MQIGIEALVEAPPEVVFAVVADIPAWPRYISAIDRIELLSPGPVVAGLRFRETRVMFGRPATEEMTVAEIAPPRRLVLTGINHGTAYRAEHVCEPQGRQTRLRLVFEGRPVTLLARLFTPLGWLFLGAVKRQFASDLADLKGEAERVTGNGTRPPASRAVG